MHDVDHLMNRIIIMIFMANLMHLIHIEINRFVFCFYHYVYLIDFESIIILLDFIFWFWLWLQFIHFIFCPQHIHCLFVINSFEYIQLFNIILILFQVFCVIISLFLSFITTIFHCIMMIIYCRNSFVRKIILMFILMSQWLFISMSQSFSSFNIQILY